MMKAPIKAKLLTFVAITALLASVALAHGDKKHIVGTLEKVNADRPRKYQIWRLAIVS